MSLSKELQTGKAGEHLVCFDLIMQGYNVFLADQGLPFDIILEKDSKLLRIQVKSTLHLVTYTNAHSVYRFGLRQGAGNKSRARTADEVDYYAFVALDIKKIAYIPIKNLLGKTTKTNVIKQTVDFKTKSIEHKGRVYSNGTIRKVEWGKYIEDYGIFDINN